MRTTGFALSLADGRLDVTPASGLSAQQRAFIRAHKTALVGLLADAEALASALERSGLAGLGWREGTPSDWTDARLLAAGELLYADGRMVSTIGRRYTAACAPAVAEGYLVDYVPQTAVARAGGRGSLWELLYHG